MLGDHAPDHPAFDYQDCMVLLQDIDHRFYIHIRRDRGETGLHEVADKKEVGFMQSLLFDRLDDNRL